MMSPIVQGVLASGISPEYYLYGMTYTGDSAYPRAINFPANTVDIDSGLFFLKNRDTTAAWMHTTKDTGTRLVWLTAGTVAHVPGSFTIPDTDTFNIVSAIGAFNATGNRYIAYGLRKVAGFMDIVPYTGNATLRTISHGLGVAPKVKMIVSTTNNSFIMATAETGGGATPWNKVVRLSVGQEAESNLQFFNNTAPTSSVFTLGTSSTTNQNTVRYFAILLGGDNVAVGRYIGTGNTSGPIQTTPWKPRLIMTRKDTLTTAPERVVNAIFDQFRDPGFPAASNDAALLYAGSSAEAVAGDYISVTDTSFQPVSPGIGVNQLNQGYTWVAIR